MNGMQKLLDFLNKLDDAGFTYSLEHNREETLTVMLSLPDERWEVDFHGDGDVDVEIFYSDPEAEDLEGEEALERLFSDMEPEDDDEYEDDEFEDEEDDEDDDEYEDR